MIAAQTITDSHMKLRRGLPTDLPFIYRLEKQYIEELENDQLTRWQENIERHLEQWIDSLPHTTVAGHAGRLPVLGARRRESANCVGECCYCIQTQGIRLGSIRTFRERSSTRRVYRGGAGVRHQ